MILGPSGPRRCHIVRHGGRYSRVPLHPHVDGDDTRGCRVVHRATVDYRRGGLGHALFSFLEGVVADGPTPPFRFGPARRVFSRLPLDVERPSSRLAELPQLEAESTPRLECVVLGSSRVHACYVVAWSLPRRSGPLEGNG